MHRGRLQRPFSNEKRDLVELAEQDVEAERRLCWPTILLLPASAERFVQLDEASVFIAPRGCKRQFRAVKRPLSVEHFEIGRCAAFVAKGGNADRLLQVRHCILLACPDLMKFFVTDERIGNISKGLLDRLSVCDQSLLVFRLSQMQIAFQRASRENRLAHLRAVRPQAKLCRHQVRKGTASTERASTRSSQRDLRKELSLGHTDVGVRGDQALFRLANIGTALDDRRRKASWNFRWECLLNQRNTARHVLRIIAEEDA